MVRCTDRRSANAPAGFPAALAKGTDERRGRDCVRAAGGRSGDGTHRSRREGQARRRPV